MTSVIAFFWPKWHIGEGSQRVPSGEGKPDLLSINNEPGQASQVDRGIRPTQALVFPPPQGGGGVPFQYRRRCHQASASLTRAKVFSTYRSCIALELHHFDNRESYGDVIGP